LLCLEAPGWAAQQKIVLLTSVDTKTIPNLLSKSRAKTYIPKLAYLFQKEFESSKYIIEIVHEADQFDLWKVLHDPTNIAVFWLSHASLSESEVLGEQILRTHKILDSRGFDITPVFEQIHPNLRFLAVIGCFSSKILASLPEITDDLKVIDRPYLRLFTFHNKIEAKKGLRQAIAESKRVLDIPEIRLGFRLPCEKKKGYRVKVEREFSPDPGISYRPAGRVMMSTEVLDVFPEFNPDTIPQNRSQVHEIFVPSLSGKLPDIRIDVGTNAVIQGNIKQIKKYKR
jgi:hypothetical protein